jgi:hypothetical protein
MLSAYMSSVFFNSVVSISNLGAAETRVGVDGPEDSGLAFSPDVTSSA